MRAVNLLPKSQRPVAATGQRSGSAYVLIGVLAVVLLAAVGYVVIANQVTSSNAEAARLAAETGQAEAKVAELAPFGEFSDLKNARIAAVRSLATERLDWERLTRELALVLPKGTWLTSVQGDAGTAPASSTSAPASTSTATAVGPTVTLSGCSKTQDGVATALVRLRRLNGADEVELQHSERPDAKGTKAKSLKHRTPVEEGAMAAAGGGDSKGCATDFEFSATVKLDPEHAAASTGPDGSDEQVPVSLGGGA